MACKGTPENAVAGPDAVSAKRSRCPPERWMNFNAWWQGQRASTGQRPTKKEALKWRNENSDASNWGGMPAPDDAYLGKHLKGMKPNDDETRTYCQEYRMKQKIAEEAQEVQPAQKAQKAQKAQRAQKAQKAERAQEAKGVPAPFAVQSSQLVSSFPGTMLQAAGWGVWALPSAQQQQQPLLQSQGSYPLAPSTPPIDETGLVRPEQQMHSHRSASVCQPLLQRMAVQHPQHQQHTYPQQQPQQVPMQSQQFLEDVLATTSYRCAAAPWYTAHGVGSGVAPGWAAAPMASQSGHGSHGGWGHVSPLGGARQPHLPQWHHHQATAGCYAACPAGPGPHPQPYTAPQSWRLGHIAPPQLTPALRGSHGGGAVAASRVSPAPPPPGPSWSDSSATRSSPFVQPPAGPEQALPQRPRVQQAAAGLVGWESSVRFVEEAVPSLGDTGLLSAPGAREGELAWADEFVSDHAAAASGCANGGVSAAAASSAPAVAAPAAAAGPELEVDDLDGVLSGLLEDIEVEWLGDSSSGSVEGGERKRRVGATGWLAEEEQEGALAARQPLAKRRRVNRG